VSTPKPWFIPQWRSSFWCKKRTRSSSYFWICNYYSSILSFWIFKTYLKRQRKFTPRDRQTSSIRLGIYKDSYSFKKEWFQYWKE